VQVDVHVHRNDRSRRAFHLSSHAGSFGAQPLALRIAARSGTPHVGYTGYRAPLDVNEPEIAAPWDGLIDLTPVHAARVLLAPRTTTRILVRLERQPLPPTGVPHLARFDPGG